MVRRASVTTSGAPVGKKSASFQMFKNLECKEEFQKVKMAGLLRELHKLATETTKEKVRDSISKGSGHGGSGASISRTTSTGADDGDIDLQDVDLAELTPEQAFEKIAAVHTGGKFGSRSLVKLTEASVALLGGEDTVVDLCDKVPDGKLRKVCVVGDLHGSLECLIKVLQLVDAKNLHKDSDHRVIVFDGDFVDRGNESLEVFITLLLLKLSHPDNIFLIRGNHEDSMTASTYGFREEIEEKYGVQLTDDIWYELAFLFAAFPLAARSKQACILHGGIPTDDFDLDEVNEIESELRCEFKTVSDPYDDEERLVQGILWSDPSQEPGINYSDRGAGMTFGPDITEDFLDRHELRYIIRAHEPFEEGTNHDHDLGDGRGCVTIFSAANYPNGEGTNRGAVLFLDEETGTYTTESFIFNEANGGEESGDGTRYDQYLTSVVVENKSKLSRAFRAVQDEQGNITCQNWATVMAETLDLPDVPWMEMQPDLAPTKEGTESIDWLAFLYRVTASKMPAADLLEKGQLSVLHEHKEKFLNIFQLLDTDGSGTIDKEEFTSGIGLLNEQIPEGQPKLENSFELFHVFDIDGDGEISIEEFLQALSDSKALKDVTSSLNENQVEALQENHEMLLVAFKYLDTDRSGAIDQDEFTKGFELLNKRLPERNRFGDPLELFKMLDLDGNGEIDLAEFNHIFSSL